LEPALEDVRQIHELPGRPFQSYPLNRLRAWKVICTNVGKTATKRRS